VQLAQRTQDAEWEEGDPPSAKIKPAMLDAFFSARTVRY
jgi:hypothetical protein